MYSALTRSIRVDVEPIYLEDESAPEQDYYVWAYRVHIENLSAEIVQLHSRYWQITDAKGRVHEVRGVGVVGEQPILHPGDSFDYTSGTPLSTPSGIMVGNYHMLTEGGDQFDVAIPPFPLECPHAERVIN
jgi:ApaG protein